MRMAFANGTCPQESRANLDAETLERSSGACPTGRSRCRVLVGEVLFPCGTGIWGGIGETGVCALATHPAIPHPRGIIAGSVAAFGVHVDGDRGALDHVFLSEVLLSR